MLLTGNTVIDALLQTVRADYRFRTPALAALDPHRRLVLVTTHRRESFGAPLRSTCAAIRELAGRFPELQFVLPVHPNPEVKRTVEELLCDLPGMHLVAPVDYLEFVHLMARADLVLTDSGGVQEEAPSLGKPVLVLREVTERPEGVAAGTAMVVGTDRDRIVSAASELLTSPEAYARMANAVNPVRRRPRERADPRGAGRTRLRMKLLVTGGTGFIGSHLAEEGRRRGAQVVVLGLADRPEEQANAALLARQGVEILPGSITDEELCAAGHARRHPRVPPRRGDAGGREERRVLRGGEPRRARGGCWTRRRRHGSSGSSTAARSGSTATARRGSPPSSRRSGPGNIYERTKVAAERMVRELAPGARACRTPILRPADVYGPRDQRLLKLFRGVSRGRFPLFGDGSGRRHMVYVDDVVSAFFAACERPEAVGRGHDRRRPAAVHAARADRGRCAGPRAARATGSDSLWPRCWPRRRWSRMCAKCSSWTRRSTGGGWTSSPAIRRSTRSRARRLLGWAPQVELAEGVRRTYEDYRAAGELA